MKRTLPWSLALAGLLSTGCSHRAEVAGSTGDASELLRSFPVAELEQSLRSAVPHAAMFASRRNVFITPPGRWFATWMVEGDVADEQVDALLFEVFAAAEERLEGAGGTLRQPRERQGQAQHEGMPYAIVGMPQPPDAPAPRILEAEYTIGAHRGCLTALALRSTRAGYWRIGCALHEP